MAESQIITDLRQCMNAATTAQARTACETRFKNGGGTAIAEAGKVFSAPGTGGKVFVTDRGKVFG